MAEVNPAAPEFDLLPKDLPITFMPLETVWPDGKADTTRRATVGSVASGYTRFQRGDVILPKITPTFEAGRVFVANIETPVGAATTEVHGLRARPGVDSRFLSYACRSQLFLQEGHKSLQGVGNLRRVSPDFVSSFPVVEFSSDEQCAIADYLDRETALIDTLIVKQEQLIATLREHHSATITRVITKGLDPRANIAETGDPSIGAAPSHWRLCRLKHVAASIIGLTYSPDDIVDSASEGMLVVRAGNI
jgi:type I restriction enzyme S subunit